MGTGAVEAETEAGDVMNRVWPHVSCACKCYGLFCHEIRTGQRSLIGERCCVEAAIDEERLVGWWGWKIGAYEEKRSARVSRGGRETAVGCRRSGRAAVRGEVLAVWATLSSRSAPRSQSEQVDARRRLGSSRCRVQRESRNFHRVPIIMKSTRRDYLSLVRQ